MKSISINLTAEVSADYTQERPAPYCMDHDNPKFSDPGDSEVLESVSIELMGVDISDTIAWKHPELYDSIVDLLIEEEEA